MAIDHLERTVREKLNAAKPADTDNGRQAKLIAEAVRLARATPKPLTLGEIEAGAPLKHALSLKRAETFRKGQRLYVNDLMLSDGEVAFGDPPDQFREAFSAFCYAMLRGHGARYIDRHQAESPEEFIDRPGKHTLNITALVITILSKLYHKPPARVVDAAVPDHLRAALEALWGDPLFNLTMIEVDRLTRLLGTVSVRPFYDPTRPDKIRLWVFLNHQLRVIPDPERPWMPAAVIERMQPFKRGATKIIWTDKWFLTLRAGAAADKVEAESHGLGRIPHVFFRDSLSFTSFFADGRGRMLCTPNAHINNRLTDLHEIEQLQGFSMIEAINPENDEITVGPREAVVFRPQGTERPYGLNFKTPAAPIDKLRASIDGDIRDVLKVNRVPEAALGAAIQQRQLSGAAIRAAMQPLFEDLDERGRLFVTYEQDLADACLRMRREHDPVTGDTPAPEDGQVSPAAQGFIYDGSAGAPKFTVRYATPDVPLDTREQVEREAHDIAHGMRSPPEIMRAREPDRFENPDQAVLAWRKNLEDMALAGFSPTDPEGDQAGGDPVQEGAALLDALRAEAATLDAMGQDARGASAGEPVA